MSTLIQCPSCSKKYNLKGRLPAVFSCTGCQQPMDLTGFPGYEPEPEPAVPARGSSPSRGGAPSRAGASHRRGSRREEEQDERHPHHVQPKKNSNALLMGGLMLGLALVVVVVVVLKKGNQQDAANASRPPVTGAQGPGALDPLAPGVLPGGQPGGVAPGMPASAGGGGAAAPGTGPGAPAKPEPPPPRVSSGTLKSWPYPEEVTAEERQQIDQAVDTALHAVGIDLRKAQDLLEALKYKAVHRLVSEFKVIHETKTFESKEGRQASMIIDRNLRRIDGFMERRGGFRQVINPESNPDYIMKVAKKWNAWLELGLWKTPLAPWDPRVDESDEAPDKGGR